MDDLIMVIPFVCCLIILGMISASIARWKGRNFTKWWIYGTLLFFFALPHAVVMPGKPPTYLALGQEPSAVQRKPSPILHIKWREFQPLHLGVFLMLICFFTWTTIVTSNKQEPPEGIIRTLFESHTLFFIVIPGILLANFVLLPFSEFSSAAEPWFNPVLGFTVVMISALLWFGVWWVLLKLIRALKHRFHPHGPVPAG